MNTDKLKRFLIGFETEVMPKITDDNTGLVYSISQSLSEDPLVRDMAHLTTGSGYTNGTFMGVSVRVQKDYAIEDYRITSDGQQHNKEWMA